MDVDDRSVERALRTLVPASIVRPDWDDVVRRAQRTGVSSVGWRAARTRGVCDTQVREPLGWGTRAL
jgi:hypothetical protein